MAGSSGEIRALEQREFGADVRFHRGARPCLGSGRKRGQHDQALGRSRGGFSTKIHLKTDFGGLPIAFHLTGGEASDSRNFETLLDIGLDLNPRVALGDKGYDSKSNRDAARQRGICPAIPYRSNTKDMPAFFPKTLYKARARIEQAVGKLKRFKRIALRCEKTAQNVRRARSRLHLDQIRPHGLIAVLCCIGFHSRMGIAALALAMTSGSRFRRPNRCSRT